MPEQQVPSNQLVLKDLDDSDRTLELTWSDGVVWEVPNNPDNARELYSALLGRKFEPDMVLVWLDFLDNTYSVNHTTGDVRFVSLRRPPDPAVVYYGRPFMKIVKNVLWECEECQHIQRWCGEDYMICPYHKPQLNQQPKKNPVKVVYNKRRPEMTLYDRDFDEESPMDSYWVCEVCLNHVRVGSQRCKECKRCQRHDADRRRREKNFRNKWKWIDKTCQQEKICQEPAHIWKKPFKTMIYDTNPTSNTYQIHHTKPTPIPPKSRGEIVLRRVSTSVVCPKCSAAVGDACRNESKFDFQSHKERYEEVTNG